MPVDRRSTYDNPEEFQRLAFEAGAARLWTALPGIVQSYDASVRTVVVQPAINGFFPQADGSLKSVQMPPLLDVPVLFQGGGGVCLTFPIAAGDECLVLFSARCIDAWWKSGQVSDPPEFRMHNLSDGFALVGLKSAANAVAADANKVMLQSDDGSTYIQLDATAHTVKITAPGGITLNGGMTIDATGHIVAPEATLGGKVMSAHKHGGVATGSGQTGFNL